MSHMAPEMGVCLAHVGVRLVLQWPWEAYHQNHKCLGFWQTSGNA
jgi:hypothetical protein